MRSLFTQQFEAARTALSEGDEPAAAESLRSAVLVARSDPSLQRELASSLLHLGKLAQKRGRAGEAEQLLTEALSISERLFGMEHAALAPLLNELSRLHLQQSHHARAEDALERLLAIARAKGEEHADVATALAGLALVKRRIGDDAAAEARYREALRIRENVLAPNHMVTVVTLEQLAETCAARGNFAEALALEQRALPTREAALGAGHATVHAARTRVTALELQIAVATDAAARAARASTPTPTWIKAFPVSPEPAPPAAAAPATKPNELEFLYKPEPRVRRPAPVPRERATTPTVTAAVAAASLVASPIQTIPVAPIAVPTRENAHASPSVNVVRADVAHRDVASGDAALDDQRSTIAPVHADSPERAPRKRTVLYASAAGVAAVAIAIAGLMLRPSAGSGSSDPVSTEATLKQRTTAAGAPVVTAAATTTGSTAIGAAATAGAARAESLRSASATPTPKAPMVAEGRAPESAPVPDEPTAPRVSFRQLNVNIPTIVTTNVDSLVRSSTKGGRESYTDQIGTGIGRGVGLPRSANADDGLVTPPTIIGRAPVPHFPDQLRSVQPQGEVVVRFRVDERGSVDVKSMIVVSSDHELFTAAVRSILPDFNFAPARSPAPESKPVAVWVSLPFQFTVKK